MKDMRYQLISADDHMDFNWLPRDLWEKRMPPNYRDRALKVVDTEVGLRWTYAGDDWGRWGGGGMYSEFAGVSVAQEGVRGLSMMPGDLFRRHSAAADTASIAVDDIELRASDPKMRLKDLDQDGHDAQIIYTLPFPLQGPDRSLDLATIRAYNDWLAEFQAYSPERLLPVALVPWWDAQEAASEVRRVAGLGFRGVQFDPFHSLEPITHEMWDPMWATAAETGLPVNLHEGGSRVARKITPVGAAAALVTLGSDEIIAGLIFCGALERHPALKVVFAEVGIGWVAWLVERMDNICKRTATSLAKYGLSMMPGDLFRRQCAVTFTGERGGLRVITEMGEETAMWAADYPHNSSTWPNSRKYIDENVVTLLDESQQRKVLCENAIRIYNLKARR